MIVLVLELEDSGWGGDRVEWLRGDRWGWGGGVAANDGERWRDGDGDGVGRGARVLKDVEGVTNVASRLLDRWRGGATTTFLISPLAVRTRRVFTAAGLLLSPRTRAGVSLSTRSPP